MCSRCYIGYDTGNLYIGNGRCKQLFLMFLVRIDHVPDYFCFIHQRIGRTDQKSLVILDYVDCRWCYRSCSNGIYCRYRIYVFGFSHSIGLLLIYLRICIKFQKTFTSIKERGAFGRCPSFFYGNIKLPNHDPIFGSHIHGLFGCDSECLIESFDIPKCSIHTPFSQRMRVSLRPTQDFFISYIRSPQISICQVKTLLGSKTVDHRQLLSFRGIFKSCICDA